MQHLTWTLHAESGVAQKRLAVATVSVSDIPGSLLQGTCEMITSYMMLDVRRRCHFGRPGAEVR